MSQINIIGNILDSSGYSVHTRQLANALSKITDVRLNTLVPQGGERLLTDKEVELIKKQPKEEINLIITSPVYWRQYLTAKRNWVFLVFEGNKVPRHFIEECSNPDIEKIFVPSKHTKDAIKNSLQSLTTQTNTILDKVYITPHGVDPDLFYPKETKKEKFTFICNKGFRNLEDRGGMQYAIQAYLEEFEATEPVELIIKINPVYGVPNIKNLIDQIKPIKEKYPLLKVNAELIPYDKLVDLYNLSHVLVAPSRADAFNIPGIESMACGLPNITTDFGGQTDYCDESNSWIIGGELKEVRHELLYEGIKWLTPSIPQLRKAMREAYEAKGLYSSKSIKALETSKQFTWDRSAKLIKELI